MLTRHENQASETVTRDDSRYMALVAELARGDRMALHGLYVALGPKCLAIGQRILCNRQEAEEILHDVFLEIWRRAKEYDTQRGEVEAWVCTIMRSRAIDRLRYHKLRAEERNEVPKHASVTPFDEAMSHESQRSVAALLAQIPEEQRAVVELAYFEDLSQAEIAQKTGVPLGTVKTRTRLAMQKLVALTRQMRAGVVR